MEREFTVSLRLLHNNNNKNKLLLSSTNNKNAFFIEGGGTKGVYAIGILKYLFEENPYVDFKNINIFGGTSVGSYLATALSLGFEKNDIVEISKIIDISNLIDSKYMFLVTGYRFLSYGYLYNDSGRQDIVYKILQYKIDTINEHLELTGANKLDGKDITFGHLNALITKYPHIYKHLLINAVDISRNEQIFLTTLDNKWEEIKLFDAILASSAIPFVFKPTLLHYDPNTNKYSYNGTKNTTINNLVDGGVSTNNPMDYFLLNEDQYPNYGLWLLKFTNHPSYVKIDGTITLLKQLANYLISGKNDVKMDLVQDQYSVNTINLNSKAGTLDLYSAQKIQEIIEDIYNQCITGTLKFDK
ncbi:putative patatin phospholipase [Tupanvirus soda lake]|uniref:Patatin phospholipase n=2 Tax=Tupanvirus TaxID=2094720 RepID=A0AC62AAC8_9VIRU|nr:putative patatin phospholipase [Tupanvirus soda lake]QKU34706.1 putative patatin phospholipase [Tupanvirus soda lake]